MRLQVGPVLRQGDADTLGKGSHLPAMTGASGKAGPWPSGSAPCCEELCLCSGPACGGEFWWPQQSHTSPISEP